MVLNGNDRPSLVGKAFERAVVQIHMRRRHVVHAVDINTKSVILRRYFHMAGFQILDRMIAAMMAELQLSCRAAKGMAKKLVPEADAGNGIFRGKSANGGDFIRKHGRIAWAVGKEDRLRAAGANRARAERRRNHQHVEALFGKQTQDVPLDAEVIRHQPRTAARPGERSVRAKRGRGRPGVRPPPGGVRHDARHQILPFHGGE